MRRKKEDTRGKGGMRKGGKGDLNGKKGMAQETYERKEDFEEESKEEQREGGKRRRRNGNEKEAEREKKGEVGGGTGRRTWGRGGRKGSERNAN